MERCSVDDKSGYRFNTGRFGGSDLVLLFAKMYEFNLISVGVQSISNLTLGLDAYRTASVIKGSGCFHS